jgi:acetyltransferase (GNAT) family protein
VIPSIDQLIPFAEDPGASVALGPDEERILTDRYCVTFSPGEHFWSTSVERLRFGAEEVESAVAEIHGLMSARGRGAAAWRVGPSATPQSLHDLLMGLGMEPESDVGSVILLLTEQPDVVSSSFDVRLVSTYEEHLASVEVGIAAFEFPEADAEDERRRASSTFETERDGGHTVRLVAFDGDRPVATGRAWFAPFGVYLGGGGTLPSDRGRGAMSTLVARAWEQSVRRGTPALVTHGGQMAVSALEKIGFRRTGLARHLVDRPAGYVVIAESTLPTSH